VKTEGRSGNQSVERSVALLNCFKPERPELSLTELTAMADGHRATVHRYTVALRHAGLLRYDRARSLYSLGPRVVELAATALAGLSIVKLAGPHMERLVAEVNETCVLSVWDGEAPVVMRVEANTNRIVRIIVQTGARLPVTSAQGQVHCAHLPDVERPEVPATVLERVIRDGVAVDEDVIEGIRAVAAPVFQDRELAAAIALVGTTAGIPADPASSLATMLRTTADTLSAELGGAHDGRTD
jgi:DNA-binding IclR family transcriptional regulator